MKIEGFVDNIDINSLNASDILAKLAVGDIVRARVLDNTANELVLKLFDGTVFSAKTMSSLDTQQGDSVELIVKSTSDNQLVLETVKENEDNKKNISDIKQMLVKLEIKPDNKNIEIAKEIKQNDIPLNKEMFGKIADAIKTFKNLTPEKAAFLVANNIVAKEKNISLLNQITDGKQKVGTMLNDTFEAISKINDKKLMESISETFKQNYEKNDLNLAKNITSDSQPKQELIRSIINKEFNTLGMGKEPVSSEIEEKLTEFIRNVLSNNSEKEMNLVSNDKILADKAMKFLKDNIKSSDVSDAFNKNSIDDILKNVFNKLKSEINRGNDTNIEKSLKHQIEKTEYENDLKQNLQKFYVKIDENTTGDDLKIKKAYKEMYEKLEIIKNEVENSAVIQKDEILNKIDNLQSNLKFINDINNHSTYMQIPINMLGKDTTGDLYILKKGSKNKKIDPQNASVLVSLNTVNLGQIDSLITVNKKNISLNLKVEDQSIIKFLKENYIELYNGLLSKGYKLVDVKYRLIKEEINAVNAQRKIMKELDVTKKSIDYKI